MSLRAAAFTAVAVAAVTFSMGARLGTEGAGLVLPPEGSAAAVAPHRDAMPVDVTAPPAATVRSSLPATPGLSLASVLDIAAAEIAGGATALVSVHLVPFRDSGLFSGVVEPDRWIWLVTARVVGSPGAVGSPSRCLERVAIDYSTGEILASGFQLSPG